MWYWFLYFHRRRGRFRSDILIIDITILQKLATTNELILHRYHYGGFAFRGNEAGGVVIMDHPMNFRYPQPVRIHPQMPYFVFSPVVESPVIFEFGFVYKARYRIITFDGEHDPEKIKRWFGEYVEGISDS